MPAPIRVLIADDHAVVRSGLAMLLEAEEDITVVGQAATAAETVEQAARLKPDVVLLDIQMPGSGLKAARAMLSRESPPRVVVLSVHDDAPHLRAALRAGVSGYVTKRSADRATIEAVRHAHSGRVYIDPSLGGIMAEQLLGARAAPARAIAPLTPRMREVLWLAAWGYTNDEIARALSVTVKTVEAHRAGLMARLGLANRAELVRYAYHSGLMDDPPATPP